MKTTHRCLPARHQTGASLLFALITLVALALAATALVRSVDTGAVVLGNLNSKKATSAAADRVTQEAITWLTSQGGNAGLIGDKGNQGYYANYKADYDVTGYGSTDPNRKLVNWNVDGSCSAPCDPDTRASDPVTMDAGYTGRWFITRLCALSAVDHYPGNNDCGLVPKLGQNANPSRGELNQGGARLRFNEPTPFYRIVVRVTGPRNSVTYTETIVNL